MPASRTASASIVTNPLTGGVSTTALKATSEVAKEAMTTISTDTSTAEVGTKSLTTDILTDPLTTEGSYQSRDQH